MATWRTVRAMTIAAAALAATATPSRADTLELDDGTILVGTIEAETATSVTFRSSAQGVGTYSKDQVVRLWRDNAPGAKRPPPAPPPAPAPAGPSRTSPAPPAAPPRDARLDEVVIRVGPGQITRRQVLPAIESLARSRGKRPEELAAAERRTACLDEIVRETVIQAAVADGFVRTHGTVRKIIADAFRKREVDDRTPHPATIPEADYRAYFAAHQDELTDAAEVWLVYKTVPSPCSGEAAKAVAADPGGWKSCDYPLRRRGRAIAEAPDLDPKAVDAVFQLAVGASSPPLEMGLTTYFFRVIRRNEQARRRFEDVQGPIGAALTAARKQELEAAFLARVGGAGPGLEARVADLALGSGILADPSVRRVIVDSYLDTTRESRDQAIARCRLRVGPAEFVAEP